MNVIGAWNAGYTGRGVVVTILDDGMEHNHTDLFQNYVCWFEIRFNDYDDFIFIFMFLDSMPSVQPKLVN